jgi:hypothetical protein
LSPNIEKLELIYKEKGDFITKKFLVQGDKGKMRIKNYRGGHHKFREF